MYVNIQLSYKQTPPVKGDLAENPDCQNVPGPAPQVISAKATQLRDGIFESTIPLCADLLWIY